MLVENGSCNDWVVTTAFYSSLHYVQNEMFPNEYGSRMYTSFENYYNGFTFPGKRPSRHYATIDLVYDVLPDCGESYEFLHNTSWTARYQSYKIPVAISEKALQHLDNIKGALQK